MADRYWVLGAGTWASTGTTRWAASSGGPAGATVPTTADNVFIDNNSGTAPFTITLTAGNCASLYANATTAITIGGTGLLNLRGNFYVSSSITWTNSSASGVLAATPGGTISSQASGGSPPISLTGAALTWNLAANYTHRTLTGSLGTFTLTSGTLNLNNYNITCGVFSSDAAAVRVINFGTGNINMLNSVANANILLMTSTSSLTCTDSGGGFYTDLSLQRQMKFAATSAGVTIDGAPPNFTVGPGASTITSNGALHIKNLNLSNVGTNSAIFTAIVLNSVTFANTQGSLLLIANSANYSGNISINGGGAYFGNLRAGNTYITMLSATGATSTTYPLIVNNSATLDFKSFNFTAPSGQVYMGDGGTPGYFQNTGTLTFSAWRIGNTGMTVNFSNIAGVGNISGAVICSNNTQGISLLGGTLNYYGSPLDIRGLYLAGTQVPKDFNLYANLIGNTNTVYTGPQLMLGGNTTLNLNGYQMKFGGGVTYSYSPAPAVIGTTQYLNFQGGNIIIESYRTDSGANMAEMPLFTNFFTDAATTMGNGGFKFGFYGAASPITTTINIGYTAGATNVTARQNAFNVYMYGNKTANIYGMTAKLIDTNTLGYTGGIQSPVQQYINFQSLNIGTGTTGWDQTPLALWTCNTPGVVGTITLNGSTMNSIQFQNIFGNITFLDSGTISNIFTLSGSGDLTFNSGVTVNVGNYLSVSRTGGTGYMNGPGNINLTGGTGLYGRLSQGSANNLGSSTGLVPNIIFSSVTGSNGNPANLIKYANLNGGIYGNIINNSVSNLYIFNNGTVNDIQSTAPGGRILVGNGSVITVANFSYSGTSGSPVAIQSNVPGSQWSIYKTNTSNTANIVYANIRDAAITSPYTFFASNNSSGNLGNNSGPWDFGAGASMVQCNMTQFF